MSYVKFCNSRKDNRTYPAAAHTEPSQWDQPRDDEKIFSFLKGATYRSPFKKSAILPLFGDFVRSWIKG